MLEAGAKAPDIQLTSLDGKIVSLAAELKRGPVALVFFKISCPTCQYTLPFLERLYSPQMHGTPLLLGISQDKPEPTREFREHFGVHFPIMSDLAAENYPASNAYGITHVPSLFLVESNGRITWSLNGFHKLELEELGKRFGRSPFLPSERVPALRPG